jgi:sugar phosphate isomerase/epimerase
LRFNSIPGFETRSAARRGETGITQPNLLIGVRGCGGILSPFTHQENRSMSPKKLTLAAAAIAALSLLPVTITRAADSSKELVKDAGPAKPEVKLPDMSPEEMKAAGERATKAAEKMGWRIGCQAYTFRNRSFFKAIDSVNALGLHYIEAYPGQEVDADKKVKMGPEQSPEVRAAIKKKLADSNVKLVSFGVTSIPKDDAGARQLFDWAKDMGIETIVSEPNEKQMDQIDKLCNEYGIRMAIHNHPNPNHYWNPDTEVKALEGHSKMVGSCSDVGHWQRSGVNPVEALKKLKGRIIESHFKDLNAFGKREAIDVPWGTGTGDAKAMLEEIRDQGAKITFLAEYEHLTGGLMQEVAHSIDWFGKTVEQMSPEK